MPKKKRTLAPPYFSNYKSYNEFLRKEFDYCCAYCNVCEPEIGGSQSFHIDHYQPKNKFPESSNDYSNLFYSCRYCNQYKGQFWPTEEQLQLGKFILNPCDHDIEDHFEYSDIIWKAKSPSGFWNIEKLRLNSQERQRRRKIRVTLIQLIQELQLQELQLKKLLEKSIETCFSNKEEIEKDLNKIKDQIITLKQMINGPQN